jgi:hypothetical protein
MAIHEKGFETTDGPAGKIPHAFRRAAFRNPGRAGVHRSVAMMLVGHETESIFCRYANVARRDLVDGLKRLANQRPTFDRSPAAQKVVWVTSSMLLLAFFSRQLRLGASGPVQHRRAEDFIDAGLISLPLGFKPRKDISINPECERLFDRTIKFANHRTVLGVCAPPGQHFATILDSWIRFFDAPVPDCRGGHPTLADRYLVVRALVLLKQRN